MGLGRDFPRDGSMKSIDNYYLLLALTHGLYALLALVTLFLWMSVRLARMAAPSLRRSVGVTGFQSAWGLPGVRCFNRYCLPRFTGCSATIDGDRME